jgi:hypothetical protein
MNSNPNDPNNNPTATADSKKKSSARSLRRHHRHHRHHHRADLAIQVHATGHEIERTFDCTIVVENFGPNTAENVALTATVTATITGSPDNVTITPETDTFLPSASWTQKNVSPFKAVLSSLDVNASQTFTFTIFVANAGFAITLTLQGDVSGDTTDPNLSNNHDQTTASIPAQIQ